MMNETMNGYIQVEQQDPTTVIVLAVVVCLSEILPFLPIKQNGLLHTIITLIRRNQ